MLSVFGVFHHNKMFKFFLTMKKKEGSIGANNEKKKKGWEALG